jgi:hypothetical protein
MSKREGSIEERKPRPVVSLTPPALAYNGHSGLPRCDLALDAIVKTPSPPLLNLTDCFRALNKAHHTSLNKSVQETAGVRAFVETRMAAGGLSVNENGSTIRRRGHERKAVTGRCGRGSGSVPREFVKDMMHHPIACKALSRVIRVN